jgi:hypothetical protein
MLHDVDWYMLTQHYTPADMHMYSTEPSSLIHILTECVLVELGLYFQTGEGCLFSLYALNGVRMELPSSSVVTGVLH